MIDTRASIGTARYATARFALATRWLVDAQRWARSIRRDVTALWFATRDPRVPWYAKVMAVCVVAYALSPIDLIPDFVPILGYLDDLILVPLGILLTVRLVPPPLMQEFRARAAQTGARPVSRAGAIGICVLWIVLGGFAAVWLWRRFQL